MAQGTFRTAIVALLMAERLFIMTDLHNPYLGLYTARLLRPPGLKAVSPFAKYRFRHACKICTRVGSVHQPVCVECRTWNMPTYKKNRLLTHRPPLSTLSLWLCTSKLILDSGKCNSNSNLYDCPTAMTTLLVLKRPKSTIPVGKVHRSGLLSHGE